MRVIFSDRNYITTRTPRIQDVTQEQGMDNLPLDQLQISTTYFDGLGRSWQTVARQASPSNLDIVTPMAYDEYSRPKGNFLPYTQGNFGDFKIDALPTQTSNSNQQAAFYQVNGDFVMNDVAPQAVTLYEASPVGRIEQQGAVGLAWQPQQFSPHAASNHSMKQQVRTNTGPGIGQDDVMQWTYTTGATLPLTVNTTAYPAGQLAVTETYNEHNDRTLEYKDSKGRLILKKSQATTSGGITCSSILGTGTLTLQAPAGMILTGIQSATYGTGSGTCADFAFASSTDVTSRVRTLVAPTLTASNQAVSFTVDNTTFPVDPSPGNSKTLVVTATYAPTNERIIEYLETYYVYDDLDLLKAVVQPMGAQAVRTQGSSVVDATFLSQWCFLYKHDIRQRIIEKQVPGGGARTMPTTTPTES
ncbi:DUF6443 domain-containing protein [Hymenobacter sp. BRD67]|uniref:DUF6443 domain-containing protein n=1 Tax=Hymenobacter sp. BRD67 TaxID=2675877 RepID=UPI00156753F4|nr:DUF6443 domain-containing protein [Hymenobacter sp. BRD67]QKG53016.1 hypothetical protein GKZ67_10875 [Hymenobacter sp. BRD67]